MAVVHGSIELKQADLLGHHLPFLVIHPTESTWKTFAT